MEYVQTPYKPRRFTKPLQTASRMQPQQQGTRSMLQGQAYPHTESPMSPDTSTWTCVECSKSFSSKSGYHYHMQYHQGKFNFWCDHCKKGFSVSSNYRKHMARHEGITFPCNRCDKRFKNETTLKYHQSEHTGIYLYNCSVCQQGFNLRPSWEEHENKHAGRRFSCRTCNKDFYHEGMRNNHEKKCSLG